MMPPHDLYATLECEKNASAQEIRAAYLRLAKKFHPDKCEAPDAKINFQKINNAYDTLSDPIKRNEYNRKVSPANVFSDEFSPSTSKNYDTCKHQY